MAIFMTLLGKYSTRSHQWEGELWQGDKMEAVIYLGALGWGKRGQPCTEEGSQGTATAGWASTLHPGLRVLGLQRAVVNAGSCETLSLPHQAPWSTPASAASLGTSAAAEAGWQASGKSKETFELRGRKSGSFSKCSRGHAAHTTRSGQRSSKQKSREEKNKSSLPQKINWKEGARRSCFVLPYLTAGMSTCLVSRYIWQIKENQEYVTCSNFAVLWYPPVNGTIIKSLQSIISSSAFLSWRAQGWHVHHGPAFAVTRILPDLPQK